MLKEQTFFSSISFQKKKRNMYFKVLALLTLPFLVLSSEQVPEDKPPMAIATHITNLALRDPPPTSYPPAVPPGGDYH